MVIIIFQIVCILCLAALGLHRCARAFSSWGERGLLSSCVRASSCSGFSCSGAWGLECLGSVVRGALPELPHGTWDPNSWARDRARVAGTSRQILNRRATREGPVIAVINAVVLLSDSTPLGSLFNMASHL